MSDSQLLLDYYRQQLVLNDLVTARKKKYVDQTGDSLRFVWRLQSCLPMNLTAIKLKLYNSSLLHGLSLNPRNDTYISFIDRNLDSRTAMLEDHALQWIIYTGHLHFGQ